MSDLRRRPMMQSIDAISEPALEHFSNWITQCFGLHFPPPRWDDLRRGITAAAKELGFANAEDCIGWLAQTPLDKDIVAVLAGQFTVGETYFFRERQVFDALEHHIFAELAQTRRSKDRSLRVWSAACCTGEEPYSIAIVLQRVLPDWRDWNITLLATDINPRFLEKARAADYGAWSFRDVPAGFQERYFKTGAGHSSLLQPEPKSLVMFRALNLVEDTYPSAETATQDLDVIFCRNVLMYFDREHQQQVIRRLHRALREGGWLVVGLTELSDLFVPLFTPVNLSGIVLYRKTAPGKPAPDRAPAAAPWVRPRLPEPRPAPPAWEPVAARSEREPARAPERLAGKPVAETPLTPLQRAHALFERGQHAEVVQELQALASTGAASVEALKLLARECANLGRLAEAAGWIQKALALDKLDAQSHYLHAIIVQETGDLTGASAALARAVYLDPGSIAAQLAQARIAGRQNRPALRDKHYQNALELLRRMPADAVVAEADGMTANHLIDLVLKTTQSR